MAENASPKALPTSTALSFSTPKYLPIFLTNAPSLKALLSLSTRPVPNCTSPLKESETLSKAVIASPSRADCRMVTSPFRLSSLTCAIFSADPAAPSIALVSFSKSASLAFAMASRPDIAS